MAKRRKIIVKMMSTVLSSATSTESHILHADVK